MSGAASPDTAAWIAELASSPYAREWLALVSPDAARLLVLPIVGVCAGLLGGMLGVGGGLVMIPALLLLLGEQFGADSLHLYKLASLISSVVVSIPAAVRHACARALVPRVIMSTAPFGLVGVLAGVALAGLFQGQHTHILARAFGAFMILVVGAQVVQERLPGRSAEPRRRDCPVATRWVLYGCVVGLPAGLVSGLLGVAGGVWTVPALHLSLGMRLRFAIANSTTIIVGLAAAAAIAQSAAVARMPGVDAWSGWWLALWLSPGAVVGGWFGATLAQTLPRYRLRQAFHLLLAVVGLRLLLWG